MITKFLVVLIFIFQTFFCHLSLATELGQSDQNQVLQISPEQALALEKELKNRPSVRIERILLAENSVPEEKDCLKIPDLEKKNECLKRRQGHYASDDVPVNDPGPDATLDLMNNLGGGMGGRDDALVVFAIIGLVVLIIWIPYTIRYLYKFFKGDDIGGWITLSTSYINLQETEQTPFHIKRDGELYGLNLLMAMGDAGMHMGLVGEGGEFSSQNVNLVTGVESKSKDKYLMGGPAILYGFKEFNGSLDIIGGKVFGKNTGLISKASMGINMTYYKAYFGLDAGALYSQIKDFQGVTGKIDSFQFFLGAKLGITF